MQVSDTIIFLSNDLFFMQNRQELIRKKSNLIYAKQNALKLKGVTELIVIEKIEDYLPNYAELIFIFHTKINRIMRENYPFDKVVNYQDFSELINYLATIIDKEQTYFISANDSVFYGFKIVDMADFLSSLRLIFSTSCATLFQESQIIDIHLDEQDLQITNYLL